MEFFSKSVCQIFVEKVNKTIKLPYIQNPLSSGKQARGSGFVIKDPETSKKYIVTNFHVIDHSNCIQVRFPFNGSKKHIVKPIAIDAYFDLVLLEIPSEINPIVGYIELGESIELSTDVQLYAAGYPCGLEDLQVQKGFKTGYHTTTNELYIQHSAALNPGNSGGPLMLKSSLKKFKLVGINNAIIKDANLIDFAIPVERIKILLETFKQSKTLLIPDFDIGFEYQDGNDPLKSFFGVPLQKTGILIKEVFPKGIAGEVLCENDFVVSIDGLDINDDGKVYDPRRDVIIPFNVYASYETDDHFFEFEIYNNFELKNAEFPLKRIKTKFVQKVHLPFEEIDFEIVAGIVFENVTKNAIDELGLDKDTRQGILIVNLISQGHLFHCQQQKLIKPGTIIVSANGIEMTCLYDLRRLLVSKPKTVVLKTKSDDLVVIQCKKMIEDNEWISESFGENAVNRFEKLKDDQDLNEDLVRNQIEKERDELEQIEREFCELVDI